MNMPPKGLNRSSVEQALSAGTLVMFENEQTVLLGVVVDQKKDKFRVFNERGREVELSAIRLHRLPGQMPADAKTKDAQQKQLQSLRSEADTLSLSMNLEELWLVTKENARDWNERELSELLFGSPSLAQYTGLRLRLLSDKIFFKRDKFGFIPRSTEIIEELKRAELVRQEKRDLEAATVDFILRRLKGEAVELPEKLHPMIELLEECAAGSERIDHGKQKEVKELLLLFTDRTKIELHGSIEERTFNLLCRIGHFTKNTNLIFYRYNPRRRFSADALTEAQELRVPESVADLPDFCRAHFLDLTGVPSVTIDDRSTKDMDDALSIEQTPEGYRLGIHISNVALTLEPGSAVETEALLRATSIYTPDQTVNMLPEELAEKKMSLCMGQVRPAMSCIFNLDQRLNILSSDLKLSLVKVARRLSYEEVDQLLSEGEHDLSLLYNIASQKEQERIEAGAVKVQKGDATVVIRKDETLELVEIDEQSPARSLVGEMMVLANSYMAHYAAVRGIPLIFRGQPAPDRGRMVDKRIPEGPARDYAIRAQLKKSTLGFAPQSHASLGLNAYAQVTSPIRRFADIINQRQLMQTLISGKPQYSQSELEIWTHKTEEVLNKANQISRESKRFWLMRYLEEQSKKVKEIGGTIIRTDLKSPIVELAGTYLTLPVRSQKDLNPGDYVRLRVVSVKPQEDQVRLEVIS